MQSGAKLPDAMVTVILEWCSGVWPPPDCAPKAVAALKKLLEIHAEIRKPRGAFFPC